jgi:hypothetical protein
VCLQLSRWLGADEDTQLQAMLAGCDAVLLKPISMATLEAALEQLNGA